MFFLHDWSDVYDAALCVITLVAMIFSIRHGLFSHRRKRDWIVAGWSFPFAVQAFTYGAFALDLEFVECYMPMWFGVIKAATAVLGLMLVLHLANGRVNAAIDRMELSLRTRLPWVSHLSR